jgi:nucleolar MIF4G domain-containing protein 1
VSASSQGPRASEKFAIVAAACIASLGAQAESPEVIATFLSRLGKDLETSLRESDSLAVSNLVRLLGCLFLSKAIKTDLMFDLLNSWGDAFTDQHVLAIAGLLTVAGLALRKSEPAQMKNFVVEIHEKASKHGEITTRARVMLDLVVDVKNNRMKDRKGALSISTNGSATLASALPPNVAAWFKTCNVDSVAIGGIPWSKVVSSSQKGFWWIPTLQDKKIDDGAQNGVNATGIADSQYGQESDFVSNAELLKLAAKLRMSTDTRRAIFLAVMGSEDAIDAAERLLRLNLKGQQEREIVRVIVECCMHETAWNPYYGMVLSRLCQLAKGHRVTLQYCLWDHIKDINGMNARKISIFSKLCAYTVISKTLPLSSVIKVVSFSDLSAKELLIWRVFFKTLLEDIDSDDALRSVLSKLAEQKDMASLKKHVRMFLMTNVGPWLANKSSNGSNSKEEKQLMLLLTRCNKAERYLK